MSDTDTAEQTTEETETPLVKIPSGDLHEQAEASADEASDALDRGDWDEYKAKAENERRLRGEIERRGEAARKEVPTEAAKVPPAAMDRLEETRQALAEAEKALEAFAGVKSRGVKPPE